MKADKPYTYERSLGYALWLLARRAYTTHEVREKLMGKGAEPQVIDRVIARLEALRYLDDARYAESYVASRSRKKGHLALRRELRRKGVEAQAVESALAAIEPEEQLERAAALLERQRWRFQKGDARKDYARAYAFLARRGFTGEVIRGALERVLTNLDPTGEN